MIALDATGDVPTGGGPVIVVNGQRVVRDAVDLGGVQTILALSGTTSVFIGVLMVSATFSFGVALRRRDLALLRLVAATGRQIRRLVIVEAIAVALPAGLVGCLLAVLTAPAVLRTLSQTELSPVQLTPTPNPGLLLTAFGSGVLIAVLGAAASARRAARIRPVEALREADLDAGAMTAGRWLIAVPLLVGSVVMLAVTAGAGGEAATPLALFGGLGLTAAAAALGPVYLPVLARMLATLATGTVSGRLAAASVGANRRRTAALVTPVMAIVAVAGVLSSVLASTASAVQADQQTHTQAELVLAAPNADHLDQVRADPDVLAVSAVGSLPAVVVRGDEIERNDVAVVDLPSLAATTTLSAVSGTLGPLASDQVAVSREYAGWYGLHVGDRLVLALFDGRTLPLAVAAVLDAGAATPSILVAPSLVGHSTIGVPDHALVRVRPGTDPLRVAERLGRASLNVQPTTRYFAVTGREQDRLNTTSMFLIAGPAAGYVLIAITSVVVMALRARRQEFDTLRLLGFRGRGIDRLVLQEAAVAALLGTLLGAVITAVSLVPYRMALRDGYAVTSVDLSWPVLVGVATMCALAACIASLLAVRRRSA
ncbi:FtsX-like permease family protein [Micromonospora sp. NPDC003197]